LGEVDGSDSKENTSRDFESDPRLRYE